MQTEYFDCVRADGFFLSGNEKRAFNEYFRGATMYHDSRAAFNLAYMYQRGISVPINYPAALSFYSAAAFMDGGEAEFNLALMYLRGLGTPVDFTIGIRHMKNSAALECIEAKMYLGTASLTGCAFDPSDIECISMIPFHRVIPRNENISRLTGSVHNASLDDERYNVIEADEFFAQEMFSSAAEQTDNDYTENMTGEAKLMLGRFLVEGVGTEYDPAKGFTLIYSAAIENGTRNAALFLGERKDEAKYYGADFNKVKHLLN